MRTPEEELARALARYEWVLANVADGIYGLDAQGRVEFVNPSAVRITGYPSVEQRGHDQHALLHHHRLDGSPTRARSAPSGRPCAAGAPWSPTTRCSGAGTAPRCRSSWSPSPPSRTAG
ncbi:PAS domain-containing protein [Blastococcus brunescens]|uniref:PAS domain-containing protein n=1 Tax=Blastococcus brunescens TaxID=1564165 RepID=A0ABZ1AXC2_9ACTN|nr:PAS domain-containing protein [Blastococcus sp. BMG 8361]WRL63219.1 PAS domain-containing protein [Blastococcus sp. BMG 8361]